MCPFLVHHTHWSVRSLISTGSAEINTGRQSQESETEWSTDC